MKNEDDQARSGQSGRSTADQRGRDRGCFATNGDLDAIIAELDNCWGALCFDWDMAPEQMRRDSVRVIREALYALGTEVRRVRKIGWPVRSPKDAGAAALLTPRVDPNFAADAIQAAIDCIPNTLEGVMTSRRVVKELKSFFELRLTTSALASPLSEQKEDKDPTHWMSLPLEVESARERLKIEIIDYGIMVANADNEPVAWRGTEDSIDALIAAVRADAAKEQLP